MTEQDVIRVGSRKSELALIQTHYVISLLKELYPDKKFEITTMTTLGDRILNISLPKIGEKSLFTKDLEEALTNGSVDMVVHSLKDLPTTLPDGMGIGAVLEREDPRDALVLREDFKGHTLSTLPPGSIIGTSSLRRTAQLSRNYPHLKVVDVRGNLNTRLRKLDSNCQKKDEQNTNGSSNNGNNSHELKLNKFESCPDYVALILAQAGLVRMGWNNRVSQVLPSEEVLYAVGQGALAIECKSDNISLLKMLAPLNHPETYCRILAERSFLRTLGGGCSAPVAVSSILQEANHESLKDLKTIEVSGAVWSLDGKTHIQNSLTDKVTFPTYKSTIDIISRKRKLEEINQSEDKQSKICKSDQCLNKTEETTEVKIQCCEGKNIQEAVKNAEPMEIENLINAHGKLFTSCPYSSPENGNCPYKLPIGQDFMGSCPFFEANSSDLNDQLVKLHPKRPNYDIKKCPFMSNQVIAMTASNEDSSSKIDQQGNISTNSGLKAQNCPFLNKASIGPKLYCGLTKHIQLPVETIEKCETLGYDLAQSLIKNGALDVMHAAQQKIRGTL